MIRHHGRLLAIIVSHDYSEMFEVKQGPYTDDGDKRRFDAKLPADLKFSTPSA